MIIIIGNIYNGKNTTPNINILTKNVYKLVIKQLKLYIKALALVVKYTSKT